MGHRSLSLPVMAAAAGGALGVQASAHGVVGYGVDLGGQVFRFDTGNGDAHVLVGSFGMSTLGLTIDSSGRAWAMARSQDFLASLDLATGVRTLHGATGIPAAFFEDMAWDAQHGRILVKTFGGGQPTNRIHAIDPVSLAATLVGHFEAPYHVGGFAMSPDGRMSISTDSSPEPVHDLVLAPGGAPPAMTYNTVARGTTRSIFDGLEYEPLTGVLYGTRVGGSGPGIYTIDELGNTTFVRSGFYFDIAFAPAIPAPGAGVLVLASAAVAAHRRRRS